MANRYKDERLYLFIDESGDPGYTIEEGASSAHYAEIALQFNDNGLDDCLTHITNWKYVLGKYREPKSLPTGRGGQLHRYLTPFIETCHRGDLCCSCVYLLKSGYTGPYLKPSLPGGQNPIWFRNFVHRKLLEFHFELFRPERGKIELVFDQYKMSSGAISNLEQYLRDNWNLPEFEHICHVNSIYTEAIQVASQLVNAVKDIALGTATDEMKDLLAFISFKDITNA